MTIKKKTVNLRPNSKAPLASKTSIEAVIILFLLLVSFASCLDMRIFQVYFYQSVGYLLNVFAIAACFFLYLFHRRFFCATDFKLICFSMVVVGYCIVSAIVVHGGLRYAGTVVNTIILVVILQNSKVSFKAIRNTCFTIAFIMLIIAVNSGGYYDNQFVDDAVNSNYIAQLAVAGMVYINYFLCYITHNKPYRIELIRIITDLIAFYILWECQSRGSLLAIVFFIMMFYFFPKKWLRGKNVITVMAGIIAIFGVLMTYLYLKIIAPMNVLFLGKSMRTRSRLWTYFWENIGKDPFKLIIGHGTNDVMRDIFGYGFHNIYLGIWYDIGLIGLVLFTGFILWTLKETYKKNRELDLFTIYAMIGFMTFQISDYFAITFTGPLVIWNYVLLGFIAMAQKRGGRT